MEEKDPLLSLREKIDALDMQIMENIVVVRAWLNKLLR